MLKHVFFRAADCIGRPSVLLSFGIGVLGLPLLAQAEPSTVRGAAIAQERCAVCHGEQGQSVAPDFPRLAGQNARYLLKQLNDFSSGARRSSVMTDKAKGLSEADMADLGAYFQSLKPAVTVSSDEALSQVGAFVYERGNPYSGLPACVTCHGTGARGTAALPRLAGQHPQYIARQIQAFRSRERSNDQAIMHMVADRITDMELKAVSTYLGGVQ